MPPGATQFTRTPRCRYSSASARVSCTTPPFDAQYAALYGWPMRPALDAMLTMLPPPSSRCGSTACAIRKRAGEVDGDDARPVLERHLVRVGELADAGAVDQHRRAGRGRATAAADRGAHRRRVGDVDVVGARRCRRRRGSPPRSARRRRARRRGTRRPRLPRASRSAVGASEPRAGAGDDRHPSCEACHVMTPERTVRAL